MLSLLFGFHLNRFEYVNYSSFLRNCDVNLNISTSRSTVLFTIYLPYSFKLISPIFTFDYSINFSPHEYLQLIIVSYIFYLCFEIYEITFFIIRLDTCSILTYYSWVGTFQLYTLCVTGQLDCHILHGASKYLIKNL